MIEQSIKLLLDEHIWQGLADALRNQGYDANHISLTEHRSVDDETLLTIAAREGRAVLTNNHHDFVPLVRFWYEANKTHAGVILSVQLPRGELLRQIIKLLSTLSANELKNTVRWLQEFK